MVGLIPDDRILHFTTKTALSEDSALTSLCSKDRMEIVSSSVRSDFRAEIRSVRPEIVVIDEEIFAANIDSSEQYRSKSCVPFKIVITAEDQVKERIFDYYKAGADEVISQNISKEELYLKFFSILRRKKILELNQLTNLPSINKTYAVVEHCLRNLSDWLTIHIDILRFQSYKVIYGVNKADNAVRVTGKILQETIHKLKLKEAFVGHLGRDNFVIVSDTNSLDLILRELRINFKKALQDLYIESDYNNGYIICPAPHRVRRREGLLELNVGYCTNIDRSFLSGSDVIEQALKNKKEFSSKNKRVIVFEQDKDFASLLLDTFEREGYSAKSVSSTNELIQVVEDFEPKIIILEASGLGGQNNFVKICEDLKPFKETIGTRILVATDVPGYQNFLALGADVYIPKPYDLEILLKEVRRLRTTY